VLPAFAVLGYVAQRGLLSRSLAVGPLSTLLVTFGLSIVIQNLLLQRYSADTRSLDVGRLGSASLKISDKLSVAHLSVLTIVLAIAVQAGLQLFLSFTRTGRILRASADDPEAAALVGADSRHIYGIATAIAFATVALAGLMFAMRSSFDPSIGPTRLLFAFEAVVIGGLGSLWGTLIGGMVLGLSQTIAATIDPALTMLAGHVIFLAVLAFRPQGLIPKRTI
jgi:branched-chain amino acid transport system permease protein